MAAFGNDAKSHRHLLHEIGDRPENDEKPDQCIFVFGPGDRVGRNAAGVVVGNHHDEPGSREDDIEAYRLPEALDLIIELGDPVHVFSSGPASGRTAAKPGRADRRFRAAFTTTAPRSQVVSSARTFSTDARLPGRQALQPALTMPEHPAARSAR